VKAPDYSNFIPGEFKMHDCVYEFCEQEIVPSKEAQEYVARIGESLIPAHQKELPADDPLKIPFRFFLVKAKSFNAVAYPNGVVLVHSGVFEILQNEAPLAFVLAHEISHAVEKHAWEAGHYHRTELMALRAGGSFLPFAGPLATGLAADAIKNQYVRSLENQADRVGLEWMLAAGYDVREAPATWKALSIKKGEGPINPFWSSHDNKTTRRSYLMAELRNNYSNVDFSGLKTDSEEFHRVAQTVTQFEVRKKKTTKTE
jgi:predicted Zn-dependent protease